MKKNLNKILTILILIVIAIFYIKNYSTHETQESYPQYTGEPYVEMNSNIPYFSEEEKTIQSFEKYSDLDSLGRCGVAYANASKDTMPTRRI